MSDRVKELPEDVYPVVLTLLHRHKRMRPCEPHMRCMVTRHKGPVIAFIDVPLAYFDKLPTGRASFQPQHWDEAA